MGCPEGSRAGFRVDATFVETNGTARATGNHPNPSHSDVSSAVVVTPAGGGRFGRAGRGERVVRGGEEGIARRGSPVGEGAVRAGLRHVPTDGGQLQRGKLPELHGQ